MIRSRRDKIQMKVFCILSDERVFASKSPSVFNKIFQRIGMQGTYVPFMVKEDQIGQAIQSLRVLHIAGANVTVPYKEVVIPHLDALSEGANIIGAINTIVCHEGCLKGYNTNAIGVMDALASAGFETAGTNALVFGTGGAAKAVVFMLNWLQAETVWVVGRNPQKAAVIAQRFKVSALPLEKKTLQELKADIVVNATAVSSPREAPELADMISAMQLPGCRLLVDLNYGRRHNFWREAARSRNIRFMNGLTPLAYQARRTLALWTGLQVAAEEFLNALQET